MEQGESVVEGAVRELLEESCLNISWWNSFHRTLNLQPRKLSLIEKPNFRQKCEIYMLQ